MNDALKTRGNKHLNTEAWLLFAPPYQHFWLRAWLTVRIKLVYCFDMRHKDLTGFIRIITNCSYLQLTTFLNSTPAFVHYLKKRCSRPTSVRFEFKEDLLQKGLRSKFVLEVELLTLGLKESWGRLQRRRCNDGYSPEYSWSWIFNHMLLKWLSRDCEAKWLKRKAKRAFSFWFQREHTGCLPIICCHLFSCCCSALGDANTQRKDCQVWRCNGQAWWYSYAIIQSSFQQ